MVDLPTADKEQSAAFIVSMTICIHINFETSSAEARSADYNTDARLQRDERVLVIWADSMDAIIPTCREFEDRLIKLLSRPRPAGIAASASRPVSVVGGSSISVLGFISAVVRGMDAHLYALNQALHGRRRSAPYQLFFLHSPFERSTCLLRRLHRIRAQSIHMHSTSDTD